jgi:hypothetical protein
MGYRELDILIGPWNPRILDDHIRLGEILAADGEGAGREPFHSIGRKALPFVLSQVKTRR